MRRTSDSGESRIIPPMDKVLVNEPVEFAF